MDNTTDPFDNSLLDYHGDQAVREGATDFSVNVLAPRPPQWVRQQLASALEELGRYPTEEDTQAAVTAIARHHQCSADSVLLLNGVSEGFSRLPQLQPRSAALFLPTYTEPELYLRAAAVPISMHMCEGGGKIPIKPIPPSDLAVIGNPTNPTGWDYTPQEIEKICQSSKITVIDEAFLDIHPMHDELTSTTTDLGGKIIMRSLTKTWALAGLRCGYAIGDADLVQRLAGTRSRWAVGTLQLRAITACLSPAGQRELENTRLQVAENLAFLLSALDEHGWTYLGHPRTPYVTIASKEKIFDDVFHQWIHSQHMTVRRCHSFQGLGHRYIRVAVRTPAESLQLVTALNTWNSR